jgi:hypothetical protein
VKFRSKILGLSAVSEQNATTSGAFDDKGESPDQKDVAAQLQEELNRRQVAFVSSLLSFGGVNDSYRRIVRVMYMTGKLCSP